jgi:hypothetical protein
MSSTDSIVKYKCYSGHVLTYENEPCGHCCRGVNFTDLNEFVVSRAAVLTVKADKFYRSSEQFEIHCTNNHTWKTSWLNIKFKNKWCPFCSKYKTESKVREILESLFKVPFPSSRPQWLGGLELDGFNESINVAFEYNGKQHYVYDSFFHKNSLSEFTLLQGRDAEKAKICKLKGIKLYVIPYTVKIENIKEYVEQLI